ncbi:MAG: hypothetical protein ACD_45C00586G0010 [uncultured bacterium]|nr:MAG: hypothetical protein ACD_45C00586G0010 [uncultured bacterium]
MRLVLLGCPGVGKGTQAKFIKEKYNLAQISTGDMLRTAISTGTTLGKQVKQIMDDGQLVSDSIMISLVKARIQETDCVHGFILDGFPRTVPQAEALRENDIHLDYVIEIRVPDAELINRLSGRRVHPASGRVYHIEYDPPKIAGKDDITGETLIQRPDDHEDTIRKRLRIYHQQTEPLVNYYINQAKIESDHSPVHIIIDGVGTVEEVRDRIVKALGPSHK